EQESDRGAGHDQSQPRQEATKRCHLPGERDSFPLPFRRLIIDERIVRSRTWRRRGSSWSGHPILDH
ncbi:MAG TPA: hypothetical protein VNA04_12035, partial [Thermoanaerobaculia bacterium]|nr:hypothetical protein [Thermoanaerobaculia bacterium]